MTDRLKGCVVTFVEDFREGDAQRLLDAIAMINGVNSVKPKVKDIDDEMARSRVYSEMKMRILDMFDNWENEKK